jgi:hypothetical protein
MVTEAWKLKTLKKEARNFGYYQRQIERYQDQIILVEGRISNMHSPKMGGTSTAFSQHQKDTLLLKNIQMKEELLKKQKQFILQRDWVIYTIGSISSPAFKAILWATLVDGDSIKELAEEYQTTADHMYKLRRKFMLEAMNEENIRQYEIIQEYIRQLREENI